MRNSFLSIPPPSWPCWTAVPRLDLKWSHHCLGATQKDCLTLFPRICHLPLTFRPCSLSLDKAPCGTPEAAPGCTRPFPLSSFRECSSVTSPQNCMKACPILTQFLGAPEAHMRPQPFHATLSRSGGCARAHLILKQPPYSPKITRERDVFFRIVVRWMLVCHPKQRCCLTTEILFSIVMVNQGLFVMGSWAYMSHKQYAVYPFLLEQIYASN